MTIACLFFFKKAINALIAKNLIFQCIMKNSLWVCILWFGSMNNDIPGNGVLLVTMGPKRNVVVFYIFFGRELT